VVAWIKNYLKGISFGNAVEGGAQNPPWICHCLAYHEHMYTETCLVENTRHKHRHIYVEVQ